MIGDQHIIKSPIRLDGVYSGKNKDKSFYINRNRIHESHFQVIAKAKRIYKCLMEEQIQKLPEMTKIKILYILHRGDKRSGDRNNAVNEVDKFFMDALVHFGKLPDDSDDYYIYNTNTSGEICKGDPHCMIVIEELS